MNQYGVNIVIEQERVGNILAYWDTGEALQKVSPDNIDKVKELTAYDDRIGEVLKAIKIALMDIFRAMSKDKIVPIPMILTVIIRGKDD